MTTINYGHFKTLYDAYGVYPKTQEIADATAQEYPLNKPFSAQEREIWQSYADDILDEGASQIDINRAVDIAEQFIMKFGAVYTLFGYDRVGGQSSEIRSIIRVILFYINPKKYHEYEAHGTEREFDGIYTCPVYSLLTENN